MNREIAVCFWLLLTVFRMSAHALDAQKQAIIDRYQAPFADYLKAIQTLGTELQAVKGESDVVKAADKFCDEANKFVDAFNANREAFKSSDVVKSMDDDPDAKKAVQDYMDNLKQKLQEAQPTFDSLIKNIEKYKNSSQIERVRNRISATFQRIQLLYM
jgi:lysyl-tRNA synthetase class I